MPDRTELAMALASTEEAVQNLADKVEIHQTTLRRGRVALGVAVFGLVLDMTLTVLVGWGLVGVNSNQSRINSLQTALQMQTDRNRASQCAVVTLFLQIEPKTINNPAYTADQHAIQAQAYGTLRNIGQVLGCA